MRIEILTHSKLQKLRKKKLKNSSLQDQNILKSYDKGKFDGRSKGKQQ